MKYGLLFCCLASTALGDWLPDPLDQWTVRHLGDPANPDMLFGVRTLAYGNGWFIAGVSQWDLGVILASRDGRNWTPVLQGTYERPVLEQVGSTFGGGRFVTVTWGGQIWTSSNALDWVKITNNTSGSWEAVAYGGGRYVAVGAGTPWFSTNGSVWLPALNFLGFPFPSGTWLSDVAYGSGLFVIGGGTGIWRSSDGRNWTPGRSGFPYGSVSKVVYGNGRFLAVSSSGVVMSSNGVDWVQQQLSPVPMAIENLDPIAFCNGTFIVLRHRGTFTPGYAVYVSTNGVDWVERTLNVAGASPTNYFQALTFGNGTFVAGGQREMIIQSQPVVGLRQLEPGLLSLAGLRNREYAIEATENLASGTSEWQTVATTTISALQPTVWRDPATNRGSRFYRAIWLP